jgi:hypothetical protein
MTAMHDVADMDARDLDALKRSEAIIRAGADRGRVAQLDAMLADGRPWFEVVRFCASICQAHALQLKPWQEPPCVSDGPDAQPAARRLLREMREAAISMYEPDPMAALAAARKAKR